MLSISGLPPSLARALAWVLAKVDLSADIIL
jgi:hypothetical protein